MYKIRVRWVSSHLTRDRAHRGVNPYTLAPKVQALRLRKVTYHHDKIIVVVDGWFVVVKPFRQTGHVIDGDIVTAYPVSEEERELLHHRISA